MTEIHICTKSAGFCHGGNVYEHPDAIDFSANLNPLGMPEEIRAALHEAINRAEAYPDPHCRELCAALAVHYGIPKSFVSCTSGASDALVRICQVLHPTKALVCAPCFSGYEKSLAAVGTRMARHILDMSNNFDVTEDFLDAITDDVELIFLCTPNNPTGRVVDLHIVEQVLERAIKVGARLVLDESFLEFTEAPSAAPLLERFENLVIVGSFTKLCCMAGVRLGYILCSDERLREGFELVGADWAVSTAAQAAGLAALQLDTLASDTRAFVQARRAYLSDELEALGLRVIPGAANYLLVRSAKPLPEALAKKNILVRPCADYHGLSERWMRIAVRTDKENEQLIEAVKEVLNDC